MAGLSETLGKRVQRTPYVALVATLVLMLAVTPTALSAFSDGDTPNTTVALVAIALMAYACVSLLVLLPRFILPSARERGTYSEGGAALLRWSFAEAAFLIGYGALALEAPTWVLPLGFAVSAVLLTVQAVHLGAARE